LLATARGLLPAAGHSRRLGRRQHNIATGKSGQNQKNHSHSNPLFHFFPSSRGKYRAAT